MKRDNNKKKTPFYLDLSTKLKWKSPLGINELIVSSFLFYL